MDSASAIRFLNPRAFTLALLAATPTITPPPRTFHPLLLEHLPRPPSLFVLIPKLSKLVTTPHPPTPEHLSLPHYPTRLSEILLHLLNAYTTSPDAFYASLDVIEPQADADMHGAYDPGSRVSLFLRAIVVAISSLQFSDVLRVIERIKDHLDNYLKGIDTETPHLLDALQSLSRGRAPSEKLLSQISSKLRHVRESPPTLPTPLISATVTMPKTPEVQLCHHITYLESLRRKDFTTAIDHLFATFRCTPPDERVHAYAALTHGICHARFSSTDAVPALEDVHKTTQANPGASVQQTALRWIRMIQGEEEPGEGDVTRLLRQAAGWYEKGCLPMAVVLAKRACRKAREVDTDRVRTVCALAELIALQGSLEEARELLAEVRRGLGREECTTEPERDMVKRCEVAIEMELAFGRGDVNEVRRCVEWMEAFVECCWDVVLWDRRTVELEYMKARVRYMLMIQNARSAIQLGHDLQKRAAVYERRQYVAEGMRLCAEAVLMGDGKDAEGVCGALGAVCVGTGREGVMCGLTLAQVYLKIGCGNEALSVVEGVLRVGLEGCGARIQGLTCRVLAECCLKTEQGDVVQILEEGVRAYECVRDWTGVRDCLYLLAMVHNGRGERERRNEMARQYRVVSERLVCA